MSDSDRVNLAYSEEVAFGTVAAIALKTLRFTSESLKQETDTASSAEITDDRQVPDVIRTNVNAGGDINFELSYSAYDDFMEASLQSADFTSSASLTATTIQASAGDNSFNDSASGFGSYVANQWISVTGFATAANNGFFKITTQTSGKLIVTGGTLVTEAAGPSVVIVMGPQIVNGTEQRSFSIEKENKDLSNIFALYTGMTIGSFSMTIEIESFITGNFTFLGVKEESKSSTAGTGGPTAAPTFSVMNTIDNVDKTLEGLASLSITGLAFTQSNNLRGRSVVGTLGADSIGAGVNDITGTLTTYFTDATLIDKYLNFTATSVAVVVQDVDDNAYVIEFPRIKYTDGARLTTGQNADVFAELPFTAYKHDTELITMRIARFTA